MDNIILSTEMNYAIKEAVHWFEHPKAKSTFEIAGAAGTGKTTLVHYIINELGLEKEEVVFMAFTGKAALQLTKKGTPARTIHSMIYEMYEKPILDENKKQIRDDSGRIKTRMAFRKRKKISEEIRLFVIDEGSMVGETIALDILSFDIPIIVLGDLHQLPPVSEKSFFLKKPDIILTQIFRQQENDPIIFLSQKAIAGERMKYGRYGEKCFIVPKDMLSDVNYTWANAIICAKNKTRDELNDYYRKDLLGIKSSSPIVEDKIICRKNNYNESLAEYFLINGMVGFIDTIHMSESDGKSLLIDFRADFLNDVFEDIRINLPYMTSPYEARDTIAKTNRMDDLNLFEYGYAISAHLSQGSQYKNVLIYNEYMGGKDFYAKWLYTAITRAEEGLIIAV